MELKEILDLIETVKPEDTAKLDQIDAMVWCWLEGHEWSKVTDVISCVMGIRVYLKGDKATYYAGEYTRSRDALKSIRPSDFQLSLSQWSSGWEASYFPTKNGQPRITCPNRLSEELSELHCSLQAIEWQRGQNETS